MSVPIQPNTEFNQVNELITMFGSYNSDVDNSCVYDSNSSDDESDVENSSDDDSESSDNNSIIDNEEEYYTMCGVLISISDLMILFQNDGLNKKSIEILLKLLFPFNDGINKDVDLPNPDLQYENENYSSVLISYLLKKNKDYLNETDKARLENCLKKLTNDFSFTKSNKNIVNENDIVFDCEEVDDLFDNLKCESEDENLKFSNGFDNEDEEIKIPVEIKKNENKKKLSKEEVPPIHPYYVSDDGYRIDVLRMVLGSNTNIENSINIDNVCYAVVYPVTEEDSKKWLKHLGELTKYHNKKKSDKSILDYFSKIGKEAKKIKF